jgi:hypothetical protein
LILPLFEDRIVEIFKCRALGLKMTHCCTRPIRGVCI